MALLFVVTFLSLFGFAAGWWGCFLCRRGGWRLARLRAIAGGYITQQFVSSGGSRSRQPCLGSYWAASQLDLSGIKRVTVKLVIGGLLKE